MICKTISHYNTLEKIGEGGMGIVYLAEDTKLKRKVALKFLPPSFSVDEEAKQRFIKEAQSASALDHNNICTIFEIDETENKELFIAMAYYDGETLKEKIKNKPLNKDEALDIIIQSAEGLKEAHENGIIHRDIKPANIFITREGVVKILDFGIAKVSGQTQLTQNGNLIGTVAYMSPEQASGETVDQRTDVWSLGVVLYEMITGQQPFKGGYDQAVIYSIFNEEPEPIQNLQKDIPAELEQIILKALAKDKKARYPSMKVFIQDLYQFYKSTSTTEGELDDTKQLLRIIKKPGIAIPASLFFIIVCLFTAWFLNRNFKKSWAREKALPEITRLVNENEYTAAFQHAKRAEKYIPNDPQLGNLIPQVQRTFSIKTTPSKANVFIKDYTDSDGDWVYIGKTPIDSVKISRAFKQWKIVKQGFETVIGTDRWNNRDKDALIKYGISTLSHVNLNIKLEKQGTIPVEMVKVSGGFAWVAELDDYLIDKYEVTNKQFKTFVDSNGYRRQEFWNHLIFKDGKIISWEDAMAEFVDATGRPGPAKWIVGDYPERLDNYPVTGVSWYEAAAYAEFVGKDLPTLIHWHFAAGLDNHMFIKPYSNFDGESVAPVGKYRGIGPFGTYDMAGNVSEWCWNASEQDRLLLGGSCYDPPYMFRYRDARPPIIRADNIGFRCVKYLPIDSLAQTFFKPRSPRLPIDMRKEKPCSDEAFRIYKSLYKYSHTELDAIVESRDETQVDRILEKVTFNTAYGSERMIAYIYLPKKSFQPPYQPVIFFPPAGIPSTIEDFPPEPARTILNSGRAFIFPVYHDTFERNVPPSWKWTKESNRDHVIMASKDLGRTIDYLQTRSDLDTDNLAYFGMSWGAWMGIILTAVDERFKTVILTAGGLSEGDYLPEMRPLNFAPRVTSPTLILNGKYDRYFPVELNVKVLLDLLGSSEKNKKLVLLEAGHDVWSNNKYRREVLDWLDQYLGPVK